MFGKMSGSVTITVEAMVLGTAPVCKTFSSNGVTFKCPPLVASRCH